MPRRTLLALLAFLAFISLGLPDGLLGVSWPSIRGDFGLDLDALGLLVAFQTAGYLVSSFLTGRILQVLPIGSLLALSTAAAATALLGFAATTSWPLLLACGLLAGTAGGAIDAGLNAYGASHFSNRVLNWLHAFFGLMLIGFSLAPIFASLVSLTPGRVGREHAESVIGFQIAAASLGGAALVGLVGVVGGAVGLEAIGAAIVALAGFLLVLYEAFMRLGSPRPAGP